MTEIRSAVEATAPENAPPDASAKTSPSYAEALAALRQRMEAMLAAEELTVQDVFPEFARKGVRGPKPGTRVPAKYRNPEKPEETWSGRGRTPIWLRDLEANGRQRDEFRIA